jgi:uncharacterized protein DUF6895
MSLDSQTLLESASAWIERNIGFFDPRNRAPEHQISYLKAFDELCLLGVLRCRMHNTAYISDTMLAHCEAIVSTMPIDEVFVSNMDHFQLLALPAALGRHLGHDQLSQLVFAYMPYMPLLSTERQPHRALDIGYCLRMLHAPEDLPALRGIGQLAMYEAGAAAVSNLSFLPHPALSSLHDFYALTHNIMFATNFGEVDIDAAYPALDREQTRTTLELAILRFLCEKNLDIVAELVWCLQMLDMLSGPIAALGLTTLIGAVKHAGYLPGPEVKNAGQVEPQHIEVHAHYHATLLAIATIASCDRDKLNYSLQANSHSGLKLENFYSIGKVLHECAHAHLLARPELMARLNGLVKANPYLGDRPRWGLAGFGASSASALDRLPSAVLA